MSGLSFSQRVEKSREKNESEWWCICRARLLQFMEPLLFPPLFIKFSSFFIISLYLVLYICNFYFTRCIRFPVACSADTTKAARSRPRLLLQKKSVVHPCRANGSVYLLLFPFCRRTRVLQETTTSAYGNWSPNCYHSTLCHASSCNCSWRSLATYIYIIQCSQSVSI